MTILKMKESCQNLNEKIRLTKLTKLRKNLEKSKKTLQSELQSKQNSELNRIRKIVEKAINDYAKDNDYDLILEQMAPHYSPKHMLISLKRS